MTDYTSPVWKDYIESLELTPAMEGALARWAEMRRNNLYHHPHRMHGHTAKALAKRGLARGYRVWRETAQYYVPEHDVWRHASSLKHWSYEWILTKEGRSVAEYFLFKEEKKANENLRT